MELFHHNLSQVLQFISDLTHFLYTFICTYFFSHFYKTVSSTQLYCALTVHTMNSGEKLKQARKDLKDKNLKSIFSQMLWKLQFDMSVNGQLSNQKLGLG